MENVETQIVQAIAKYETIIIHRHQRSDPDAFGSQLGLKAVIENSFPNKKVYAVGENNPGLEWVGTMDRIELSDYKDALVIVNDTADTPRIDDNRYAQGKELIKIDHHPNLDQYGDIMWVDDLASSTSELITRLVADSDGELKLNEKAARLLYIGLAGDTGRFMYATDAQTFRIAAQLMEFNFDYSDINRKMTSVTLKQARFAGLIQQEMTVEDGVGYIVLTNEMIDKADLGTSGTEFAVGIPGGVDSVMAWAIFEEQKEDKDNAKYRVRIRSKKPTINTIAMKHRGGGHAMASGAKASSMDEINEIIAELKQAVKEAK